MIGTHNFELINRVITSFTRENEALLDQLQQIGYFMRGFYNRDDVWSLSYLEREKAIEFLNKRVDDAKEMMKNQIPVFL